MATPNIAVDVRDFLAGPIPASLSNYLVKLSETKQGYTNASGQVTLSSVTPGTYTLQIFGLGIPDRTVVVPDEAGPLDAADLAEGASVSQGVPSANNPLVAGDGVTLKDTTEGLQISANLAAGDNITLTTDPTTGEIEIAATGGGESVWEESEGVITPAGDTPIQITADGVVVVGDAADAEEYYGPSDVDALVSVQVGETATRAIHLESVSDPAFNRQAYVDMAVRVDPGASGGIKFQSYDADGSAVWEMTAQPGGGNSCLSYNTELLLRPDVPVGPSALAYQFFTKGALESDATSKIASFGTTSEKASISASGALRLGGTSALWTSGTGSPEGAVTAPVGSLYTRTDGGANTTLYVKESGTGNTGWVAK